MALNNIHAILYNILSKKQFVFDSLPGGLDYDDWRLFGAKYLTHHCH